MSDKSTTEFENKVKEFLSRNALTIATHPLEYAKILIQVGYEPFAPTETVGFFFRHKYLGLPNLLTYLKYIKSVDGFTGCYRGIFPRLFSLNCNHYVYLKMNELCPWERGGGIPDESHRNKRSSNQPQRLGFSKFLSDCFPADVQGFLKTLSWDAISLTVGTTVSYPFHLIAVRSMAQFVGRETKYSSIYESFAEIFNTEGIKGFFNGLFPKLIGELINLTIVATFVFIVTKKFSAERQTLTGIGGGLIANSVSYQFMLVSNNMAVNNSGLLIGGEPYTRIYTSWYDCWASLRRDCQLARASSVFARQYIGRTEIRNNKLSPVDHKFGPIHPRGLGALEEASRNTLKLDLTIDLSNLNCQHNYI